MAAAPHAEGIERALGGKASQLAGKSVGALAVEIEGMVRPLERDSPQRRVEQCRPIMRPPAAGRIGPRRNGSKFGSKLPPGGKPGGNSGSFFVALLRETEVGTTGLEPVTSRM